MKEDCNIVAYFQYVDEIMNTLEGFGEPVFEDYYMKYSQNIIREIQHKGIGIRIQ